MALTTIANRKTPSVPIQETFSAQAAAVGKKITTLFAHMAAVGATAMPYQAYLVTNVGSPSAAKAEVNALGGTNSQAGNMAAAFVQAALNNGNPVAFRIVFIPSYVSNFGPNQEATTAVKFLRSDMFVSCYPGGDSVNAATLLTFTTYVSGIDRDLTGQFGSFMTLGSIDPLATQEAYNFNSPMVIVAALPDSNTAAVPLLGSLTSGSAVVTAPSQAALSPTGTTTSGSAILTSVSSTAGIYSGASITGTGIPANTYVESVTVNTIQISQNCISTNSGESLTVTNLATAGVYPGAQVSGTGIPANTTVLSLNANSVTLSQNATSTATGEAIAVQNVVSQPAEVIAAAHAGGMMASQQPYNPLDGVNTGLVPPQKSSDWTAIDPAGASEAALNAGLSPLVVVNNVVQFLRTVTTWLLESDGITPVTAYFDWQELVAINDYKEIMFLVSQQPPFNGNPGGTKASISIANNFKDEGIHQAQLLEDAGMFQGVKTLAPLFQVQPSTTVRGRFDFYFPINVLPGLMVLAGNIQAQSVLGNFTL